MNSWVQPVSLAGQTVRVEPLHAGHATDLADACADGELHRLWYTTIPHPDKVPEEIEHRLALQAAGTMVPFAVLACESGQAIGMTTFLNIDAPNRRLEIGATWYRQSMQRTGCNTECKLLMLRHAFETLQAHAVEFRTHFMNRSSRKAISRLGAKLDGVLRSHTIMPNGTVRDTAVYSIISGEWPAVQANLNFQLEKHRN